MKKRIGTRLVELVAYSPALSRIAFGAMRSRAVANFPLYRYLLRKKIEAVKKRNLSFPSVVSTEGTNACNARCVMCPYPRMRRPKGAMAMPLYRKIVDECARHDGVELRLTGFGEPLLDRDIFERIRYAKESGIAKVQLTTNASLLDGEASQRLLDSGIDEIMFSVDGYDKRSYERIRVGLQFEKVLDNVKGFHALRGGRKSPRTIASVILFSLDASHRREMVELWGSCADRIFIKPPEDWAGEVKGYKEGRCSPRVHYPCPYIWTQFLIAWDGTVGLCCRDFCNIRMPLGSVAEDSIARVWSGETLARIREKDARGRVLDICKGCGYAPNWWGER